MITRIYKSKNLTESKRLQLVEIAKRLGVLRTEIWRRYGSINGIVDPYVVRKEWIKSGRVFGVPARLWEATLYDTLDDIKMSREAAKVKVRQAIYQRTKDKLKQKHQYGLLKADKWVEDKYLCRKMRKHFKHGQTDIKNHIVLSDGSYFWFHRSGIGWLEVMSLKYRERIAIPLNASWPFRGNIRLIVKDDCVEVHVLAGDKEQKPCGDQIVGIDKGYTEAFVDSDAEHYGIGLGKMLSEQSDKNKLKYQQRNKIQAIAEKSSQKKRKRIEQNNLGRKKLDDQKKAHQSRVKQVISSAVHQLVNKAKEIRTEDLTKVIRSTKIRTRDHKRRMSGWVKGVLKDLIESISHRRGATVVPVQSAYSSQECHKCGCLGDRKSGVLHCSFCKAEWADDWNAAVVVKARPNDPEIGLYTPYQTVRSILLKRTAQRLRSVQPGVELQSSDYQPTANY